MEKKTRDWIAKQMEVFLKKFPHSDLKKIREFLMAGSSRDFDGVKKDTLFALIRRLKKKFEETGSCLQRRPGQGRPSSVSGNKSLVQRICRMFVNKETPGQRGAAKKFGISKTSVKRILKRKGIKSYHKVREQALQDRHKAARVQLIYFMLSIICTISILFLFSFLALAPVKIYHYSKRITVLKTRGPGLSNGTQVPRNHGEKSL